MSALALIAIALISSAGMMLAWIVQRRTGNSGWIDTMWSAVVGVAALAGLALSGQLSSARGLLCAVLVLLWSARLAIHIGQRSRASHDDPRYEALLAQWGPGASRRLFWFLQVQALVSFLLAVSVVSAVAFAASPMMATDWIAAIVGLSAVTLEMISDSQLTRFRRENAGRGLICDTGLWQWSRHPNYFFEWLYWCAWPILALSSSSPWAAISLVAPVMMYALLVHVSGIPPLEEHMLKSRGDAFRRHQQRVNAFFPGPTKSAAHRESFK